MATFLSPIIPYPIILRAVAFGNKAVWLNSNFFIKIENFCQCLKQHDQNGRKTGE
jgi:hypothetical protein